MTVAAPVASADILPRSAITDPNLAFLAKENKSFNLQPKLIDINHILVIHGTVDKIVPCNQGRMIYAAAREPKKLLLQTGGDHTISSPRHQTEFLQAATDWFRDYLG